MKQSIEDKVEETNNNITKRLAQGEKLSHARGIEWDKLFLEVIGGKKI